MFVLFPQCIVECVVVVLLVVQDGQGWQCSNQLGGMEGVSHTAATHLCRINIQNMEPCHGIVL